WVRCLVVIGIAMALASCCLFYSYIRQTKLLKDTNAIVNKLAEVKEGRTGNPLMLSRNSILVTAAKDLNELENGIEKAVELQNRSNKMRVELLTNVSHDLKTPLTSIINYADLLCEEELPETAAEYAAALQGKAYRLKNMVQDVFDLSKATSGNLNVEPAVIDLVKLIKQTLADMDERIQESDLTFKLNISNEPLLIEADGEKLYRVFQNLFVNALQYSLENSRVHIQLLEEEGFAVARVKNTSRLELNFDPDEIIERFVRADSSRTTEGSGLGLSIVQSFAEACGGQFKIETDADMFTACVRFPLSQKSVSVEPVVEEGV
uniref:sensor histidine kinase n=1 Tax=Acetatifactor sp. TaxID=1872090 RepID=UPI0040567AD4